MRGLASQRNTAVAPGSGSCCAVIVSGIVVAECSTRSFSSERFGETVWPGCPTGLLCGGVSMTGTPAASAWAAPAASLSHRHFFSVGGPGVASLSADRRALTRHDGATRLRDRPARPAHRRRLGRTGPSCLLSRPLL